MQDLKSWLFLKHKYDVRKLPDVKMLFLNADELHWNAMVMTNVAKFIPVQMVNMVVDSGAAALLVANTDECTKNPIFFKIFMVWKATEECEYADHFIDIPVVIIHLTSDNILTTAVKNMQVDEIQG